MIQDPVSNGYVEFLIQRLNGSDVTRKEIKNSDFIEYEFIS